MVRRAALALGVAAAALTGCGRDLRDVVVEHRAAVEARLDAVKAARDAARAAPKVGADAVAALDPQAVLGRPLASQRANTAVAYLEDLEAPAELGAVPHRVEQTGLVNRCAAALATHREPYDPKSPVAAPKSVDAVVANDLFQRCEGLEYLVVLRTVAFAAPGDAATTTSCEPVTDDPLDAGVADAGGLDGGARDAGRPASGARDGGVVGASLRDAGPAGAWPRDVDGGMLGAYAGALGLAPPPPTTCLRYEGGYLRVEAFVFDLDRRAQVGAFTFEAESSARLDVAEDRGGSWRVIEADFTAEVARAFRRAARDAMGARFVEAEP
jgi:hypothetical protein